MDAIGISALGIDSIAHECVASGTKNTSIAIAPNSCLSTGDQGVHGASGGTKGCHPVSGPVGSGLPIERPAQGLSFDAGVHSVGVQVLNVDPFARPTGLT